MIEIDLHKAISLMEQAVAIRGETYKVDRCAYTKDGEKGCCIVGKALELAGVDVSLFVQGGLRLFNTQRVANVPWGYFDVKLDDDAQWVFAVAQQIQDARYSWGEALEAAKDRADKYMGSND